MFFTCLVSKFFMKDIIRRNQDYRDEYPASGYTSHIPMFRPVSDTEQFLPSIF